MKPYAFSILIVLFFSVSAFCAEEKSRLAMIVMPEGDVTAGRKAFVDLSCHSCHNVSTDPSVPVIEPKGRGPDLSTAGGKTSAGYQTSSIISPSHIVIYEYWRKDQDKSPMPDLTRSMTVRQLIDLIAYLQSFEKRNTD